MNSQSIFFSGRDWIGPGVALASITLFVLLWSYSRQKNWRLGFLSIPFKMLGVLILVFCLLEPLVSRESAKPGANIFVELADNSKGMQIKDRGQSKSRGESLSNL